METFHLHFRLSRGRSRAIAANAVQNYLVALSQNGQLVGDTPTAIERSGYQVFANAPRADALGPRMASPSVRRAAKQLIAAGVTVPRVRRLGPEPESRAPCACRRQPYLVLFTNFLSEESPVRCGKCFGPVPLYTLPPTGEAGDFQDLLRWQSTYQALDWLFIGSSVGERYGHRQMSDCRSPLTKEGRELAALLEKKARRPVFYYLMKHFGVGDAQERRRRCPACGKQWALVAPLHRIFDFRCDRCRLLSNVAFDVRVGPTQDPPAK